MRKAVGEVGLVASCEDRDDLTVWGDADSAGQKCRTKSSVMRAFTSGQMKANEAFLKLLEKKKEKKKSLEQ